MTSPEDNKVPTESERLNEMFTCVGFEALKRVIGDGYNHNRMMLHLQELRSIWVDNKQLPIDKKEAI